MKKFITAVFCTALALSSGLTAYAAEAPDRESLEAAHRQSDNLLELIKKLIAASKEGEMVELSDTASHSPSPVTM